MQLIEEGLHSFRLEQAVGWYPFAGAALLMALPVLVVGLMLLAGGLGTHRELSGQRTPDGGGTLTLTETAPFTAPRAWQAPLAQVTGAQFAADTVERRRGGSYPVWRLSLAMREGEPWSVVTLYDAGEVARWQTSLDEFFKGGSPATLRLSQPHLLGTLPDGWAVALLGTVIAGAFALAVVWSVAESASVVVDGQRQLVTIRRWHHFKTQEHALPFAAIVRIAPFDAGRVKFGSEFMLAVQCRDETVVDLGRFDAGAEGDPRAAHAQAAERLAQALRLR